MYIYIYIYIYIWALLFCFSNRRNSKIPKVRKEVLPHNYHWRAWRPFKPTCFPWGVYACTMIIVLACTMIIVHACTVMILMHVLWS